MKAMFMAKKSEQMRWLDQEPFELYALWTDKDMDGLKRRIREDQSQIRSMKYRLHSSLFFRVFLKRFANRVYAMGILAGVTGAFSHTFYYPHDRKDGDGNDR